LELIQKGDNMKCFADKDTYCAAPEKKDCDGCVFYKTKEQVNKERMDAKLYNQAKGIPTGQKYIDAMRAKEKEVNDKKMWG
jgi:hypothetical protein